jgi:hypothetical protein
MSYPNPVFSTFAFISFILVSIPFPWHLEGLDALLDSFKHLIFCSVEYWYLSLHGLDVVGMSQSIHQLDRVEWKRDQLGTSLVRHMSVRFLL